MSFTEKAVEDGAAAALATVPGTGTSGTRTPGTGTMPAWEAPPLPVLPGHPELPADLLLRQLPATPAARGARRTVAHRAAAQALRAAGHAAGTGSSSGAAGP